MIDLTDLGLEPLTSASTDNEATVASNDGALGALVPGSLVARVLYSVWCGTPIVVTDAPPGAGKSTLVVDLVSQLLRRSDLKVVIGCPTRRGVSDLAARLVEVLGTGEHDPKVVVSGNKMDVPDGAQTRSLPGQRTVVLRTIASCAFSAPECDVFIVDEAYQATFADVSAAADGAEQVLLVGDPGQIGPVITLNTSAWERRKDAPHRRAPEVFALDPDAQVFQMDATYRVGADTVAAIAPLYGFEFVSKRPDRTVFDHDGTALPELGSVRIESAGTISDVPTLTLVADHAEAMIGRTVTTTDADGTPSSVTIEPKDVAVVVAHNAQSSTIDAMLRARGHVGVTVGTADRLQGGQWLAVVALDPLVGHGEAKSHQLSPGRLCVMASRHMAHLTWVHDDGWEGALRAVADEEPDAKTGIAVRRHLTANLVADHAA